ncbi:DNA polymerase III subunit beta [Larkinella knui]|uniref:Beta sliding clamp n=1 Tax=Larkinella knui TaxID=2025310 RepID=A0A3P1CJB6_9BACT|nr:DNA polymerase III subunit beta [Larkinella knui]RRB13423.1 DNA polymerase III subunit beta [Larkinella knui]
MTHSLIVPSGLLRKALQYIGGVVAKNPIVPVLENAKVEVDGRNMKLTGSNLFMILSTTIEVEASGEFIFLMPLKKMNDLLALLPEQPLTISTNEFFGINISAESGKYKLSGENPIDFPKTPPIAAMDCRVLDSTDREVLVNSIENSLYAVNTDDLRPAMCTVCLRLRHDGIVICSTNGHQLSHTSLWALDALSVDKQTDVLLHRQFANILVKLHKEAEENEPLHFSFNQNRIEARIGNRTASAKVVDERFPDFENAIPKNNPIVVKLDRKRLMGTLRRILLMANQATHQVRLDFGSLSNLTVSAQDLDYSNEGSEEIKVEEYEGEAISIGFNAKMLVECLDHATSDTISLELSAPNRAMLGYDEDRDHFFLQMPTMLATYA